MSLIFIIIRVSQFFLPLKFSPFQNMLLIFLFRKKLPETKQKSIKEIKSRFQELSVYRF